MRQIFRSVMLAMGFLILGITQRAWADVTVTMQSQTIMNFPQVSSTERSTYYFSGKKLRIEGEVLTTIVDASKKQIILISDANRSYSVSPLDSVTLNSLGGDIKLGGEGSFKVVDTGKTSNVLGYQCQIYSLSMTLGSGQNTIITRLSVYATDALVGIDPDVLRALLQLDGYGNGVEGMPLKEEAQMTSAMGDMTTTQEVSKISTDPIPRSKFDIPAGYTKKHYNPSSGLITP